jgi:hypothetical protein
MVLGPDGSPRKATIRLESSSVSESNRQNEHALGSEQKGQSKQIERDFQDALTNANVVLYLGHARTGSGPGFKPLPALSWSWIDAALFRPSRREMMGALEKSSDPASLIGIYACYSDQYYRKGLQKVAPSSGLVLTDEEAVFEDEDSSTLGTVNSILGLECESDFAKGLSHSRVEGFFRP